eukprot:7240798-Prorocentrum_lima.AAC.1
MNDIEAALVHSSGVALYFGSMLCRKSHTCPVLMCQTQHCPHPRYVDDRHHQWRRHQRVGELLIDLDL